VQGKDPCTRWDRCPAANSCGSERTTSRFRKAKLWVVTALFRAFEPGQEMNIRSIRPGKKEEWKANFAMHQSTAQITSSCDRSATKAERRQDNSKLLTKWIWVHIQCNSNYH